jgi:hypothetical protein
MTTPTPSVATSTLQQQQQASRNVNLADVHSFPSLGDTNQSTTMYKKHIPYTTAQDFISANNHTRSPSKFATATTATNGIATLTLLSKSPSLPTSTTANTTSTKKLPDVTSIDNFPSLSSTNRKSMPGMSANHTGTKPMTAFTTGTNGSKNNHSPSLSIDTMKGILGPVGYKAMKTYTREYVNHEMEADSYIDHIASLFPNGYSDVHFWNFVPDLIRSFPNTVNQRDAFAYMENLHRMRNGALNHEAHYHHGKNTSTTAPINAMTKKPPPSSSYATLASTYTPVPPQPPPSTSSYTPTTSVVLSRVAGNAAMSHSTSAWVSGNAVTTNPIVPTAKTSSAVGVIPPSPTIASSRTTTATNTSSKKKRNNNTKEKNELRALAFG